MVNPAVSSRNKAPTPSRPTGIPRAAPSPSPAIKARPPVAGPSNTQRAPAATAVPKPPSVTKPTSDYDETIKRLKKDLASTFAALNSSRTAQTAYAHEVEALQSAHQVQFFRLQDELETVKLALTESRLEIQRILQGRLRRDVAIAQFQKKESELDAMLDEAEEKDEVWEGVRAGMEEREAETEGLRKRVKEAEKGRTDAMTETSRLKTELGTLQTSLERANLKHQSTLSQLTEVTKRRDELSGQIERWASLEGKSDSQAQELQRKLVDVEAKLEAANIRAEEAEEKLINGGELQEQLDITQAQMVELKKVVKKIKSESSTLSDENKTLQSQIKELEASLAKAHKRPNPTPPMEEEEEEAGPSTPPPPPQPKAKPKPKPRSKPPPPPPPEDDDAIEFDDDIQEIEPPPQPKAKPKPKRKAPVVDESTPEPVPPPSKRKKEKARATSQAQEDEDVFGKRKRGSVEDDVPVAKKAKKEKESTARKASGSKKKVVPAVVPDDEDDDIYDPNKEKKKQVGLNPFKKRKPVATMSTWGGDVDGDDGVLGGLMGRDLSPVKDMSKVPPRAGDLRTSAMRR
ncbi:hypothetical protein PENSPDRAFT_656565 [Peniophora sp. CONT]|nr:hypothetical protein PENSPDRAFT_656565 [Peniophora sp. CONT]